MKYTFDAVIIGGGAAGLICAVAAKKHNPSLRVAVLEKNDRVGKKLLSTGNGRCNLTNENISPEKYVGKGAAQTAAAVLQRVDAQALLAYFRDLGLLTSKDSEGRYYPLCRQASAVLDVLRFQCDSLGVSLFCGEAVKNVKKKKSFAVQTEQNLFLSDKLVIACGSPAAPKLGGCDSLDALGLSHRTSPFVPALCPVRVRSDLLKSLKGLRVNAEARLINDRGVIRSERGEVQFNEDNLSGICLFDLSLYTEQGKLISLDLLPDISENELYNILLRNKASYSKLPADNIFTGILQKRIAQAVLKQAQVRDFSRACDKLGEAEIRAAAKSAKALTFAAKGNMGFDRAQACRGGILIPGQIAPDTLQSRLTEKLWFCGEALDVCGECGGFNLHFAFAGGIIVGEQL